MANEEQRITFFDFFFSVSLQTNFPEQFHFCSTKTLHDTVEVNGPPKDIVRRLFSNCLLV